MKLFSKKYGDKGQDLIVIHGLFGMSDNWNTLGKQFSKYCKVHLIDLAIIGLVVQGNLLSLNGNSTLAL